MVVPAVDLSGSERMQYGNARLENSTHVTARSEPATAHLSFLGTPVAPNNDYASPPRAYHFDRMRQNMLSPPNETKNEARLNCYP